MRIGNVESGDYQEFTVKVWDPRGDTFHTVHHWAFSQEEANTKALAELRELLDDDMLEIV